MITYGNPNYQYLNSLKPIKKFDNIKILSFDVETFGNENKFYMGSTYDGNNIKVFYDKEDMKKELLKTKYSDYKIFATNLEFDINALYQPFDGNWERFLVNGRYITVKYRTYKKDDYIDRTWLFLDTLTVAPMSVEQMGYTIGLPKLDKPSCLGEIPKDIFEKNELEKYNIRDTMITYNFMKFFNEALNKLGGRLQNTIAGCSMDIFRRKYMKHRLLQPDRDMILRMHEGYYGGRVEVFQIGYDTNKRYYDINSLYPFVMRNLFPDTNTIRFSDNPNERLLEYEGMSYVTMSCPDIEYPYLPVRRDKVIFPIGNIEGVYTHFEIRNALLLGYELLNMKWSIYYLKNIYLFDEFCNDLYSKRMEFASNKDVGMKYVTKILMNSLYGRFGLNIENKNVGLLKTIPNNWTGKDVCKLPSDTVIIWDENDNGYYSEKISRDEKIPAYVNPIISVYVTAYARNELYKLITKSKPIYCDTDSVVTDKILDTSKKLGGLKKEYDIDECWFLFPKAYRLIGKNEDGTPIDLVKWKGIPRSMRMDFWNNGFEVTFDKIIKTKEGLRRGLPVNTKVKMTKTLKTIYHKRQPIKEDFDYMNDSSFTRPIKI